MYKLCIVLGWPVIRMQLLSMYQVDYSEIWNKIKQHRILTSDALDSYYSHKAEEENLLDEYQAFMATILSSDLYTEIDDKYSDVCKTIAYYLKKKCKNIAVLIDDTNEFKLTKSACRFQYSIKEAAEDENGPFGMYSVKAVFFAEKDENAKKYIDWLENLFKDEKEINIIDPFILSDSRNYTCLKNYILPLIGRGCTLNIHTVSGALYIDELYKDAEKNGIFVNAYWYGQMHDRYITTKDRIIVISIGCDFMQERNGRIVVRNGTNFILKKKRTNGKPLEVEMQLAGMLIETNN